MLQQDAELNVLVVADAAFDLVVQIGTQRDAHERWASIVRVRFRIGVGVRAVIIILTLRY